MSPLVKLLMMMLFQPLVNSHELPAAATTAVMIEKKIAASTKTRFQQLLVGGCHRHCLDQLDMSSLKRRFLMQKHRSWACNGRFSKGFDNLTVDPEQRRLVFCRCCDSHKGRGRLLQPLRVIKGKKKGTDAAAYEFAKHPQPPAGIVLSLERRFLMQKHRSSKDAVAAFFF